MRSSKYNFEVISYLCLSYTRIFISFLHITDKNSQCLLSKIRSFSILDMSILFSIYLFSINTNSIKSCFINNTTKNNIHVFTGAMCNMLFCLKTVYSQTIYRRCYLYMYIYLSISKDKIKYNKVIVIHTYCASNENNIIEFLEVSG